MMKKKSDHLGKSILHQTLIIDLGEFSVQQISYKPCTYQFSFSYYSTYLSLMLGIAVVDVGLESIRITEANYPEGVRRVFLINGKF